jgi:hypothetical protein
LGDGKNGVRSWVQGWNVGVRVQGNPSDKDGTDTFTIYATGGTNGACPDRLIGVVRESPNGPQIDLDLAVARAVVEWAKTPGNHGGNPYQHEFVRLAMAALGQQL